MVSVSYVFVPRSFAYLSSPLGPMDRATMTYMEAELGFENNQTKVSGRGTFLIDPVAQVGPGNTKVQWTPFADWRIVPPWYPIGERV